jgi:hypothetical protein
MSKYTINGKEYSEFDINKRCAELMRVISNHKTGISEYEGLKSHYMVATISSYYPYGPCSDSAHCWPIIEKCWDELNKVNVSYDSVGRMITNTKWNSIMFAHNCTKLFAACICLIAVNDHE